MMERRGLVHIICSDVEDFVYITLCNLSEYNRKIQDNK
jgi:hypothetical protein